MRVLYKKVKENLLADGLNKENIIDMVNTIIRRKRFKMTVCEVMVDYVLSLFHYRSLRRMPLSQGVLDRRRKFS